MTASFLPVVLVVLLGLVGLVVLVLRPAYAGRRMTDRPGVGWSAGRLVGAALVAPRWWRVGWLVWRRVLVPSARVHAG